MISHFSLPWVQLPFDPQVGTYEGCLLLEMASLLPAEERRLFVVLWVFCPRSGGLSDTCVAPLLSPTAPKTDAWIVVQGVEADVCVVFVGGPGIYLPPQRFSGRKLGGEFPTADPMLRPLAYSSFVSGVWFCLSSGEKWSWRRKQS